MARVVASLEEVVRNIETYGEGVRRFDDLANRIRQHPAWYAVRNDDGAWIFGPSKFIGYQGADPEAYLAGYRRRDGKETEPVLSHWFVAVDPGSALGRELRAAFDAFAAGFDKSAHQRWRISVPRLEMETRRSAPDRGLIERIAVDAEIVGGRPHIRGTRVRVSDILAALASGETAEEIVEALPYLTLDDVRAALHYAATSLDHRVLVAA